MLRHADRPLTCAKTDIVKQYVDWAVKQGFAVIDVNLPKHVVDMDMTDSHEHEETNSIEFRTREATQLLTYLWENYIELNDSSHVFLMGTNTGHGAIVNFIKTHSTQAQQNITKAISFIEDVSLQSCKSQTDDGLARWYYDNSMVLVANEHHVWASDLVRKPRKGFGRLSQSDETSISAMLIEYQTLIFDALKTGIGSWKPEDMVSDNGEIADMQTSARAGLASPARLPPVQNFSFSSPSKNLPPTSNATGSRSPSKMPAVGNFAPSPKQ